MTPAGSTLPSTLMGSATDMLRQIASLRLLSAELQACSGEPATFLVVESPEGLSPIRAKIAQRAAVFFCVAARAGGG
jgi:hypothetical protein